MKRIICRLFGHRKPDSRVATYGFGMCRVYQCPRCLDVVAEARR